MKEFKLFISRGNVVQMATGLIIALYFGAIVKSFVDDILMPPIGLLLGGVDFSHLKWVLKPGIPEVTPGAGNAVPEVAISYGIFINTIITFLIVAFAIFLVVKAVSKMQEKMEKKAAETPPAPPAPSVQEILLAEIRDLLKKNSAK